MDGFTTFMIVVLTLEIVLLIGIGAGMAYFICRMLKFIEQIEKEDIGKNH